MSDLSFASSEPASVASDIESEIASEVVRSMQTPTRALPTQPWLYSMICFSSLNEKR